MATTKEGLLTIVTLWRRHKELDSDVPFEYGRTNVITVREILNED